MQSLKDHDGEIQFFYSTDIKHNFDEEDNSKLPIIKPSWISANGSPTERVCLISLNHQTRPYIMIKDCKSKKFTAFEY
jgi:hypothetical protein